METQIVNVDSYASAFGKIKLKEIFSFHLLVYLLMEQEMKRITKK